MYYPYFRGKQYELITIRESAPVLAGAGFVPIIEPVRSEIGGLRKSFDAIRSAGVSAVLISNPQHGEFSTNGAKLAEFLEHELRTNDRLSVGLLLTENMRAGDVIEACERNAGSDVVLVHAGYTDAKGLMANPDDTANVSADIFLESACGKLYRRHFRDHPKKILVRDGFERRRGRDHPDGAEFFSDLHITFEEENMDGFGDFLIVGDEFLEGGGPAYTIVIHLTFIDDERDEAMYISHFKSKRQDTPKDPAGKFAEALQKLMNVLDSGRSKFAETSAIAEFRDLHARGHYPGLGYVKKLSMKHHIETLAGFLANEQVG
ncbi:sce7725 family protein [Fuerstiella marisgermanici]|uniref:Uncharacterized protein n=1 Tax=Fuerstiella marisgermanici TaxID=1891926 RepID=A0A1P8WAK8_9PLAN|nr:sce7725 family protein [Fuerstiella marisgermanici]APZ91064.1 hypothetical protein Fuma_00650 [Fuerstiella marisgermanici]